ncbi:hypothetical protein [Parasedimentitalea psychrophila]|uniref:Uncharacterized protein n=1 Tax=Parasedimentitalea psychrophila TaxID=2997337 RepID=A0A9Y2L032_9RHOB|nr:hypothetical protein [Parasedimentitalea psychrophila]WIY25206.1 hypothetical protein QPJ95_22435 [Parasedimentitalea psychrophila]
MAFGLSEDVIPYATIQMIFDSLDDEEALSLALENFAAKKDAHGHPMIGELFSEIQYRMIEPNAVKPTQQLLNALFSIGETVSRMRAKRGFALLGPSQVLYLLIAEILKTYSSGEAAAPLIEALKVKRRVSYGIETFCDYGRLLGEIGASEERMDSPLGKADWERFRDAIKPLFDEDLASEVYLKYPKTWMTIRAYAYFYGKVRCKKWIIKSANSNTHFYWAQSPPC